jgi:hypothetical protein
MKEQLVNKGILEEDITTKNTRQLRNLCLQHEIPTSRSVENVVVERN